MKDEEVLEIIRKVSKTGAIMAINPTVETFESWEASGKPVLLYCMGRKDNMSLWGDQGYGWLFLLNGKKIVDTSDNMVTAVTKEGVYVGLSGGYGETLAGLYKKAK